jgi:hypothetical protein
MNRVQTNFAMKTRRTERLKEAVIAAFSHPAAEVSARLRRFNSADWKKVLFWLDASGLALYLLDRLTSLGLQHCLPAPILVRLMQNLRDNRVRTAALLDEADHVSRALRARSVTCALLKGFTLFPESVPDCSFRYQLDLDFLVADRDRVATEEVLSSLGYRLHAVSGDTLEFKSRVSAEPDMNRLYQARPQRSLELHLLPAADEGTTRQHRLARVQLRAVQGKSLPALSPADLFLQQALHLFKHLCSEHTRASWVLEFVRHLRARHDDLGFWREVESLASMEERADIAIGAVTLLATRTFGEAPPAELSRWTIDRLPSDVRLWIETYGQRVLLTDFPGSKLYLLLRTHLQSESGTHRAALRRLVLPRHLPPRITHGEAGESFSARLRRFRVEAGFVLFRLRFHLVEGLRYAVESSRWQRRLTGITN